MQSAAYYINEYQVTGEPALFINPGFTKRIVGLKKEESDAILQLLFHVCVFQLCPKSCARGRLI